MKDRLRDDPVLAEWWRTLLLAGVRKERFQEDESYMNWYNRSAANFDELGFACTYSNFTSFGLDTDSDLVIKDIDMLDSTCGAINNNSPMAVSQST